MSQINTILFDFGGVFTVSPFSAVEQVARERGHEPLQFSEIIFGPYHLDTDHPWHQLERGEISIEKTRENILALSKERGAEVDLWDVLIKMANGGRLVNEQVVDLLAQVKQAGYHTGIVTNNVKEFSDAWKSLIPMHHVDAVIDSAFEGIRKPNPEIFRRAIQKLSNIKPDATIDASRCVFLDDVPSNVQSAIDLGMQGIVVTPNPDETVSALKKLLKI